MTWSLFCRFSVMISEHRVKCVLSHSCWGSLAALSYSKWNSLSYFFWDGLSSILSYSYRSSLFQHILTGTVYSILKHSYGQFVTCLLHSYSDSLLYVYIITFSLVEQSYQDNLFSVLSQSYRSTLFYHILTRAAYSFFLKQP